MEMFCFPYPRDTDVESIRVPLLARTQYSITGENSFSEFFTKVFDAEKEKINASELVKPESASLGMDDLLASTTQAWLFFGIASEALGRSVKHEEFADVSPGETHPSIDVRIPIWFWRELKAQWVEIDGSLTAAEFEVKRAQLKKIYDSAILYVIYVDLVAGLSNDEKLTQVLLSVHMLLYLVAYVLDYSSPKATLAIKGMATTKLLKERMVGNGWCKKRLNLLYSFPMQYPALYFLSSLKPPRTNAEDHSSCSSEGCLVTSKLSKPRHRSDECLCEDVAVPVERVNTIVGNGGIPLIRITRSSSGKTELEVVPYTPSSKFIAISHVWADQQFGSARNCLPKCQVGYLEEVILSLPTSMTDWGLRGWIVNCLSSQPGELAPPSHAYEYFWLDSFCIPQAAEHADLRNKAIESMNLIYAAASHTLVFDKGLQALDAGRRPASLAHGGRPTYYAPKNLLDVVAYICASNWMGRAWTLQEGILSGNIVFPLQGSLAYLKLLWPRHDSLDGFGGLCDFTGNSIPNNFRRSIRDFLPRKSKIKIKVNMRIEDEPTEPFREVVRRQLFEHMKRALNVEEYRNYARTPVSGLLDPMINTYY
jgi:hypothetical protein